MSFRVAVFLILQEGDRALVLRRSGTGFHDGEYGLPGGKVEHGERLADAMVREVREEVGIDVVAEDLHVVHVAERDMTGENWLDFFFTCRSWSGSPSICEPDKCDDVAWLQTGDARLIDYVRKIVRGANDGVHFSFHPGM